MESEVYFGIFECKDSEFSALLHLESDRSGAPFEGYEDCGADSILRFLDDLQGCVLFGDEAIFEVGLFTDEGEGGGERVSGERWVLPPRDS